MDSASQMPFGIEAIREKIILRHYHIKQHEKDESDEQAYFVPQKKYKAQCQKCGEYGHKPGNTRCSELKSEIQDPKLTSSE